MIRIYLLLIGFVASLQAQALDPPRPSMWWVHCSVAAHIMSATEDGLSSWKQAEGNRLYAQSGGPQTSHFYRTGAGRMTGLTLGAVAVSYAVAYIHPSWRKYIGILNLGAAAAHQAVVVNNVVQNPYYR